MALLHCWRRQRSRATTRKATWSRMSREMVPSVIRLCFTVTTSPKEMQFSIARFARQNDDHVTASTAATMKGASEEKKQVWKHDSCLFSGQGPVSRKSRKLFGREKPFVKLRLASSGKPVFSYKGIKIKRNAKFRASRRLRSEDTKRIMSPEMRPKIFGTFEKRAPGARFSKVSRTFRARKAGCQTTIRLLLKSWSFNNVFKIRKTKSMQSP